MAGNTVTVCSKLPFGFTAECGGKKVTFHGARGRDVTGDLVLTPGYGMTRGIDADWFAAWAKEVGDFAPLANGSIFAAEESKAQDEAAEMAPEVQSGFEQKTAEELGVEVVEKDD